MLETFADLRSSFTTMHFLVFFSVLSFIEPFVLAASVLEARQDLPGFQPNQDFDPNMPPAEWVDVGCYTDTVGTPSQGFSTRTLRAQSMSSNKMTPRLCIDFCSNPSQFPPSGYKFAGMEDGTECFCDNVIHPTGSLTSDLQCTLGCPGDIINGVDLFNCGGNNFLRIYTNSTSSPAIPTTAIPDGPIGVDLFLNFGSAITWQYVGCYSDSPNNHTLQNLLSGNGYLDIFACVNLCEAGAVSALGATNNLDTFRFFAGIENGGMCWCGPSVASTSQRLPDIACESLGCQLTNSLACGGIDAMVLYQFIDKKSSDNCNPPIDDGATPFFLDAVFLDNSSDRVPLSTVGLINRPSALNVGPQASILSACHGDSNCPNPMVFQLTDISNTGLLFPNTSLGTVLTDGPIFVPSVGTPHFIELQDSILTFGAYCLQSSLLFPGRLALTIVGPRQLPFNVPATAAINIASPWSLCANGTAFGRLDVVYKQLLLVPGFNLTKCRDVELLVTYVD